MTTGARAVHESLQESDLAAWLRDRLTTTPARLRLLVALLALALLTFGAVAEIAASSRRHAANAVAYRTTPLVRADVLYSSLSDADATAATTFLTGGLEPVSRRARYVRDIRSATSQLTDLAAETGASRDVSTDVTTVATNLPVYTGLVETARANNREGHPVGAAYLRQASGVMRERILPAAERVYEIEADRLGSEYRAGTSTATFLAFLAPGLAVVGLLALAQLYITRLSNRVFNPPLLAASLVLIGILAWGSASFVGEQNALSSAQRNGSDSVEVLSATRILLLRAQSDESLALAARGGGDTYAADFDAVTHAVGPPDGTGGLLLEATRLARRTGSTASLALLTETYGRYLIVHRRIAILEAAADFRAAVRQAVGPTAREAPLADRMQASLARQIDGAQASFAGSARDAATALRGLWLGIPLLALGALGLMLLGFALRLAEYR